MNRENKAQEVPNAERLSAAEVVRTLSVFALVRTAFSSERALMAWMRTSVSLYSFGFTITKFMDYLERPGEGSRFSEGPRRLPPDSGSFLPVGSAGAILAIGVAALVSIFLKWHL